MPKAIKSSKKQESMYHSYTTGYIDYILTILSSKVTQNNLYNLRCLNELIKKLWVDKLSF